jgi:hypothetical protein
MFERRKVRRHTALCIRYRFHEIRFHLWSESESSGLKVMKNFGLYPLYHLMAMDRIHSLLEASIMPAIAIERRVSDGNDFT